jgi:hypothetical protein
MARWCKARWLMDCHHGGFSVKVMAPFVDKGWGWLNGAKQYDDRWCYWMVAEMGGSEIELWNWGFNIFLHHFHILFYFLDKAFNHCHETRNLLLKSTKTRILHGSLIVIENNQPGYFDTKLLPECVTNLVTRVETGRKQDPASSSSLYLLIETTSGRKLEIPGSHNKHKV